MNKKCVVLFSGGLDSMLAVKIMQENKFDVIALFFKLPFSKDNEKEVRDFCKKQKVKLKIFDCTRRKLLQNYLGVIKKPCYGLGAGINPCLDCKIFMFKQAKEFADEEGIDLIVTGEVLGERPMSQMKKSLGIIEEKSGLRGRLLRPLSAKLLDGVKDIDKHSFYDIEGRRRDRQIALAGQFKIKSYSSPAGGCLLCEKILKKRFDILIGNNLIDEKTLRLVNVGRHFFINNHWFVVGRNEKENKLLELFKGNFVEDAKGKPAVYFNKKDGRKLAEELQEDYRTGGKKKYSTDKL